MDGYDVRERKYSLPVVIGGGALVVVLVAIVAAVVLVSESSAVPVHRKTADAVPQAHSTALARPASSVVPTPDAEGLQAFKDIPPLPTLGQLLSPVG